VSPNPEQYLVDENKIKIKGREKTNVEGSRFRFKE
jgi:hypothetical protein